MTSGRPRDIQDLIASAGGRLVGRTRLQKAAYLLERMGMGYGFFFAYHHYGPYSEDLALAAEDAVALRMIDEETHRATWGGNYSVYTTRTQPKDRHSPRAALLSLIAESDAVALELAATVVFFVDERVPDPWEELAVRKAMKATPANVERAKALYAQLKAIPSPRPLPDI